MVTSKDTINKMLETLKGFDQNSLYHDLDLYGHTMKAVNKAIESGYNENIIEALYYHDIGKLECFKVGEDGYNHYFYHSDYSVKEFYHYAGAEKDLKTCVYVALLISHHTDYLTRKRCRFLVEHFGINFLEDLHHMQLCDRYAHSEYAKLNHSADYKVQDDNVKDVLRFSKIEKRVKEHHDHLVSLGYEVVMIALQGSQNYSCDTEFSDVDTKAIVVPSFSDFVLNKQPASTTIILDNDEHIDVKDIRFFLNLINKSNVAYLEILFTNFKIINPKYRKYISTLFKNKELISMHDKKGLLNCVFGVIGNKYKALKHPYPNVVSDIEKFGYCRKQYHHLIRCYEVLERLIKGDSFKKTLIPTDIKKVVSTKYDIYPIEEVDGTSNFYYENSKKIKDEYIRNNQDLPIDISRMLDKVKEDVLKIKFCEDILNEENVKGR